MAPRVGRIAPDGLGLGHRPNTATAEKFEEHDEFRWGPTSSVTCPATDRRIQEVSSGKISIRQTIRGLTAVGPDRRLEKPCIRRLYLREVAGLTDIESNTFAAAFGARDAAELEMHMPSEHRPMTQRTRKPGTAIRSYVPSSAPGTFLLTPDRSSPPDAARALSAIACVCWAAKA